MSTQPDVTPEAAPAQDARNATFEQTQLTAADGHRIPVYLWKPPGAPRGLIHICHGMAEHGQRYARLARYLNEHHLLVVAHDHRGHGQQTPVDELGHYADEDGWDKVTADVGIVQGWIHQSWPTLPCYLMGHSMGSFIAQGYLTRNPEPPLLAGLILSGSNRDKRVQLAALRTILRIVRLFKGPHATSPTVHKLTFGAFARSVETPRTRFDWLSHDEGAVYDYIADPYCGFDCTNQLWSDLAYGLTALLRRDTLQRVPADLPILIISGAEDPVGEFGQGPRRLAQAYRDTGHSDVTCIVFQGMRHEPFNEKQRAEAEETLIAWLTRHR
ncbi:alpha/beta hydrolase [Marinobacter nanhaiticus D15-8W]|uniref:Alpha/beta hydrolase n=1 Tax=Marinobacter nanhaiticus D15-8W TaxID=626887 RepID=N6WTB5_9GAMM|nr:alpha/beta hydrolase [Marinobacter nanhaiticus]ENO14257.1 alpha/beta hydrolase [Marinobacter nanhaiticus D15-8W]BES71644.1 alpha/beta hydrolase [Marinobacter nanhaiticus D15-8W]